MCALVRWEIHGLLAAGPEKPEVEKHQQQQQQLKLRLRLRQQATPIGRKQNMARRQPVLPLIAKNSGANPLSHLALGEVAQFLPRIPWSHPFIFGNQLHLLVWAWLSTLATRLSCLPNGTLAR